MGAEESKAAYLANERNQHYNGFGSEDMIPATKSYDSKPFTETLKTEFSSGVPSEYRTEDPRKDRSRTRRKPIVDEKENRHRHRRHRSTDDWLDERRQKPDDSSNRKRITSDDRDKEKSRNRRKQENKRHDDIKAPREHKNVTGDSKKDSKEKQVVSSKERKKKQNVDSNMKATEKQKSKDKQNKSKSCLPNVSEVRRRKLSISQKKSDLEKHKKSHRSVPDLSSDDTSRVGAWLNSNQFVWPHENQELPPAYAFPYGSLPRMHPYPSLQQDANSEPRPIVDGMGSPVGFIYPNGRFVPDGIEDATNDENLYKYPTPFRYSMPAFMQAPYPYFVPPHFPYYSFHSHNKNDSNSLDRSKLMHRSRSQNFIDELENEKTNQLTINHTASRIKRKSRRYASKSSLGSESVHPREYAGSQRSPFDFRTGEFYSDIKETRNSLDDLITYKANPQISVDDVKHAVFANVKTPEVSDSESDDFDETSSDDSSRNDIEFGSSELKFPTRGAKAKRATTPKGESEGIRVFRPVSKREVFIDGSPKKTDVKPRLESNRRSLNSEVSRRSPVMRLGEKQSIVATSFLVEGAKVFCLTKTTQTSPQLTVKKVEKTPKLPESPLLTSTLPHQTQNFSSQSNSSKRDSGTWYGLTGSHTDSKSSFANEEDKPRLGGSSDSSSTSSSSTRMVEPSKLTPSGNDDNFRAFSKDVKEVKMIPSPRRNLLHTESFSSSPSKSPTPKPRLSKVSPIPDLSKSDDNVFENFPSDLLPPTRNVTEQSIPRNLSSDSSDSEPLMRDDDHVITKKLVRIDSRDSLTMKRRKIYRRSSSLTDKTSSNSLDKKSPTSTKSDLKISTKLPSLKPIHKSSDDLKEPFMDALFHKAKSEEALKHEISRSSEALLSDLAPLPQKETLQERASRILGLNSNDLRLAKEREDANRFLLFGDLHDDSDSSSEEESSTTSYSSDESLQASTTRVEDKPLEVVSHRGFNNAEGQNSESFAISVTESLLNKVQDKIEIKDIDYDVTSNSSGDVSSLSSDSASTTKSGMAENEVSLPIPDAEYLIEVSDSVLEETTVPCSVKPHDDLSHLAVEEYKLPSRITVQPNVILANTPTAAQVSIAASYADSIYDRVPTSAENLSDDATETDSLDQSARFQHLVLSRSGSESNEQETQSIRYSTAPLQTETRLRGSPVPVAPFSAPLTPDEVDIVKQLYNSSEELQSTSSDPHPGIDPKKAKVARAIGFNVANIGQGISKMGKVENSKDATSSNSSISTDRDQSDTDESENNDKPDSVEEVLQSLGLNPEKSWLVEL